MRENCQTAKPWGRIKIESLADSYRGSFDSLAKRFSPSSVAIVALLIIGAVGKVVAIFSNCRVKFPINPMRLQITFDATRFTSLLNAEGECNGSIKYKFWYDIAFCVAYGLLLPALFVWLERWRRFSKDGAERTPWEDFHFRQDLILVAPIVAALFDIFPEDVLLGLSAKTIETGGTASAALVVIGSVGAAIKWVALCYFGWGVLRERSRARVSTEKSAQHERSP